MNYTRVCAEGKVWILVCAVPERSTLEGMLETCAFVYSSDILKWNLELLTKEAIGHYNERFWLLPGVLTPLRVPSQAPRCTSGRSGCARRSGGRGRCCVTCCSTSRMVEPASSGSASRPQCESLANFLLVTQCVMDGLLKLRSPETLTSVITLQQPAHWDEIEQTFASLRVPRPPPSLWYF